MERKDKFKPYVPAEKITPELTLTSVITGVILAVVFGAANAYLGLKVGLTVSASIPASVVAMGVIRVIMRKNSILESNIVQTTGSAGESLASGAVFTLPALFLWAAEGKADKPDILQITLIALLGGLLGVFFMVPLRNALIVKEHSVLPYPEGTACAEVLLAGEKSSSGASVVFYGIGLAALFKFITDGLKAVSGRISVTFRGFAGTIGTQIYPAVISVGYICGARISSYMFAGGLLSWMVLIPIILLFGENSTLLAGGSTIGNFFADGGADAIWQTHIRYIGAGALACGGIISLIKSLPLILSTFSGTVKNMAQSGKKGSLRTEKNLQFKLILPAIIIIAVLIWLIPAIPVTFFGAVMIVIFGFFFTAVSSRMVGLVGSSNNPVSGMAIATLLITSVLIKVSGGGGTEGMIGAIAIGSVICIVSAIAGDTSQDLKTGYLLGATPKKQQIGELIGVAASSLAIGAVMYLLDSAWGFGSEELGAPQATLMKLIVEGVMENDLPWALVFIGVFIAVAAEIAGIPVLPFAIGIYLPIHLTTCIMAGGLVRLIVEKSRLDEKTKKNALSDGTLFCSGMIAGEGLVGVILAIFAVFGTDRFLDISHYIPRSVSDISAIVLFVITLLSVLRFSLWRKRKQ